MIDADEIEAVAANARITVTDEQVAALQDDLAAILDSFQSLDEIDTQDVEPAFHPVEHDAQTRDDVPEDCLTQEEATANTENVEDGYFKGPKAV